MPSKRLSEVVVDLFLDCGVIALNVALYSPALPRRFPFRKTIENVGNILCDRFDDVVDKNYDRWSNMQYTSIGYIFK